MTPREEAQAIEQLLARERMSVDAHDVGRTSFLSHIGAMRPLTPGPWIAHRDLIYALALTNLSQGQRASLAHAVRVEHGRTFGVGRCELETSPSGLPFGGASLRVRPRRGGPTFLYTWGLSGSPRPVQCEWLLLRAQPEWTRDEPLRNLGARGLETLEGLGGTVVVLVGTVIAAQQVMQLMRGRVPVVAHPRFAPLVYEPEAARPRDANVYLWPYDGLDSPVLRELEVHTVVLLEADESLTQRAQRWAGSRGRAEVIPAAAPGRIRRVGMEKFWRGCGSPRVLLRGDPGLVSAGSAFLRELGATVVERTTGTQLGLF